MTSSHLTYQQILVTNNLLRAAGEETYFLGVTRTVQESIAHQPQKVLARNTKPFQIARTDDPPFSGDG